MAWLMMKVESLANLAVKESMELLKKKVENEVKVQEIVDSLKSKHWTKYTVFQL